MRKNCTSCGKEFSTTIKLPGETIYSVDRVRCLDCFPFKKRLVEYKERDKNLRNIQLRCKYGIDLKQYEEMLLDQNGLCAICDRPPPNSYKKRLSVDHNHETGEVRGLLCTRCNSMLGWLEKNRLRTESYLSKQQVNS
jgi:DNA-directed RNA polymerase subunit RPC12/RpoP